MLQHELRAQVYVVNVCR